LFGSASAADNLVQINGAAHAGQIIFIQAVETTPITLKHLTAEGAAPGNIWMPTLADYIITDKEIVMLQWDTINSVWSAVANFTDGSGGKTFSASVASIGTESAGEIVINAPTSQSIHFRVAGSDRAEIDSTGLTMPSGNHGVKLIGGDIDVETGNITMGATGVGDLTVGDGRVYIYDKGTNDSKIFMKHGAGASTDQYLYSDGNGIELAAASGNTVKFRVAGTVIANVRDTGLYMNDSTYIIPATSGDVMGIMPKNTGLTLTTGTKGSILIPTYESTTTTTDALLTTWFGNQAGAIGMQYDTSKATGSGRMMLYIRGGAASGTWRGVDFDVNPP
jgi:hypothetical protein